jgi:SAM-dependent methyltransferase
MGCDDNLRNCRCTRCNGLKLVAVKDSHPEHIIKGAIRCSDCGTLYDICWGVPFLGYFQKSDLCGLIEIVANAAEYLLSDRVDLDIDPILELYHASEYRAGLAAGNEQVQSLGEFLPYRYAEWLEIRCLTYKIDLRGKKVLDVGAGLGYDAQRLVKRGARVTALEYNPVLARLGALNLPAARWIGGLSHVLPFADGCFDLVFCNAALHHMQDIPSAVTEMLRVLKPGGWLVTTSDPYMSDDSTEGDELAIFDSHEGVSSGINERVPRIAEYLEPLQRQRCHLEPTLFTHQIGNLRRSGLWTATELAYLRQWDFDDALRVLTGTSGSIACKVRLMSPISAKPAQQIDRLISPGDLAARLDNKSAAMAYLAKFIPQSLVNMPFPGEGSTRFHLLNGWQAREPGTNYRQAFGSGRWFFRRRPEQGFLSFEVLTPDMGQSPKARIRLTIDGQTVLDQYLHRGLWSRFMVPVNEIVSDEIFAVEIELVTENSNHAERVLRVRRLELHEGGSIEPSTIHDIESAGLSTILDLGFLPMERISLLFHPHQEEMFQVIASLTKRGILFNAIVPEGQESLYASQGVSVERVYPDPNVTPHAQLAVAADPDVVVAPTLEEALRLVDLINVTGSEKQRFAVFSNGRVEVLLPHSTAPVQQSAATISVVSELRVFYQAVRRFNRSAVLPLFRILFKDPRSFIKIVHVVWERVSRVLKRQRRSTKVG